MKRKAVVGALLLTALAGCAYFNTFYHARKFYREAESAREKAPEGELPAQASDLYLKAAKKCAKVITEHPDSRWVDDALLLMGDCFYHRGEYERALKKYDELLTLYPESSLAPEANYMRGMVLWNMERYPEASLVFRRWMEATDEDDEKLRAWLMLGRSELAAGDEEAAANTFREILAWGPAEQSQGEIRFWLGESLARAGRLPEAREELRLAAEGSGEEELLPKIEVRLGEMLEEMGQFAEAADFYLELVEREADPRRRQGLEIRLAQAEVRAGRTEGALARLERLIEEAPGTDEAAEAQFRIGLIYQRELRDYEAALEAYDKVREISPGAPATRDAGEERRVVLDLRRHRERLADLDSTKVEELARTHFLLAETLLLDLSDPEGALEHYRIAHEASPEAESAPQALLAASWLLSHSLDRRAEARELLRRLADDYPETPQGRRARLLLEDGELSSGSLTPPGNREADEGGGGMSEGGVDERSDDADPGTDGEGGSPESDGAGETGGRDEAADPGGMDRTEDDLDRERDLRPEGSDSE